MRCSQARAGLTPIGGDRVGLKYYAIPQQEEFMRRILVSLALAGVLAASTTGLALAGHPHTLHTPGTTVEDIARGNTWRCTDHPAGHAFHDHVHIDVFGKPPGSGRAATDMVSISAGTNPCP